MSPLTPEKNQNQLPETAIAANQYAAIRLNAEPIEQAIDPDGKQHDVLAWVSLPANDQQTPVGNPLTEGSRLAVCKPTRLAKDGHVELIDFDNKLKQTIPFNTDQPRTVRTQGTALNVQAVSAGEGESRNLLLGFNNKERTDYFDAPTVTALDGTTTVHEGSANEGAAENTQRNKYKRRFGKAMMLLGAYATFASGGFIDRVGEVTNDAGRVTAETYIDTAGQSGADKERFNPTWMYFPPFAKRNAAGEVMSDAEIKQTQKNNEASIIETMGALDDHNSDIIFAKAQRFAEEHHKELLHNNQLEAFHEQISTAKSPDDVLTVLDTFMQHFNKHAVFAEPTSTAPESDPFRTYDPTKTSTEDVRHTAHSVVDAFGLLPAFVVRNAHFSNVRLSNDTDMQIAGLYHNDAISIPILTSTHRSLIAASNAAPDAIATPKEQRRTILHELGHASSKTLKEHKHSKKGLDVAADITFALQKAANMNEEVSDYAPSDDEERKAENFSTAFDIIDPDSLAHPDEWRRFNSGANKQALGVLIAYSKQYPGLLDYVLAQQLARQSPVALSRYVADPSVTITK